MNKLPKAFLFIVFVSFGVFAQTKTSVVCHQKQMWLVNDAQAVSIGKCKGKTWIAPIKLEEQSAAQTNLSKDEKQVFALLQKTSKESFKPVSLSQATEIAQAIQSKPNKSAFTLNLNTLPSYIEEFLVPRKEMEIIITTGVLRSGQTEKDDVYEEYSRYNLKVPNENLKIGQILEQFKDEERKCLAGTKNEWELAYQNGYYLETAETREKLDSNKTIADYKLKTRTVLRVFTQTR